MVTPGQLTACNVQSAATPKIRNNYGAIQSFKIQILR